MDIVEPASNKEVSRRTVTKAMAWAAPAIAVAAVVPAAAASLRKDPGINGWVLHSTRRSGCRHSWEINSRPSDPTAGPDGAPFGLYVYDVEDNNVVSNAYIIIWVIGNRPNGAITWIEQPGHSASWADPTWVGTQVKPDGITYTGYRWNYTGPLIAANRVTGSDGVERLYLGDFHVSTTVNNSRGFECGNLTYWTERHITIDPDGAGPLPATDHTFQRRRGTLGSMTGLQRGVAPQQKTAPEQKADSEDVQTVAC